MGLFQLQYQIIRGNHRAVKINLISHCLLLSTINLNTCLLGFISSIFLRPYDEGAGHCFKSKSGTCFTTPILVDLISAVEVALPAAFQPG